MNFPKQSQIYLSVNWLTRLRPMRFEGLFIFDCPDFLFLCFYFLFQCVWQHTHILYLRFLLCYFPKSSNIFNCSDKCMFLSDLYFQYSCIDDPVVDWLVFLSLSISGQCVLTVPSYSTLNPSFDLSLCRAKLENDGFQVSTHTFKWPPVKIQIALS